MKFSSNNTAAIFGEQIDTVSDFFEKWSDCERTVVIYALLKRLPYSCLKFMQSTIEQTFAQCTCIDQIQLMEQQSNCKLYLMELCDSYKMLTTTNSDVQLNKDSIFNESDRLIIGENTNLNNNNNNNHNLNNNNNHIADKLNKKEDILNDILNYMPMLKIGNDDAKQVYLSLIPFMVDDARRGIVNTLIVQQILSFLSIHPALSTDDRRSLNHYIRYLEDHIINRIQTEQCINNSWQTIAPPAVLQSSSSLSSGSSHKSNQMHFKSNENLWDTQSVRVSQDFADTDNGQSIDLSSTKSNSTSGSSTKAGTNLFETGTDDHHVSFSKNGTEILDFDPDMERSNTQIAFSTMTALNDFLTVPMMDPVTLKTRRSNSLTTGTKHHEQLTATMTSSTENLSSAMHKPRSFSLSIESPRSSVTSSGSETRLDDFKPPFQAFQTHHIGMSNIAAWLKSLRLHKYVWIFASFTYEQMMEITEEYLSKLDVTKGARHKLVICIQKLKERYSSLEQIEQNLISGSITTVAALEEMTNIIMTPMKPIELYNKEDVAAQYLKVLDLVCNMLTTKQINSHDEEAVSSLLWILEKAVHNEAFVTHMSQLKEYRFRVSKLKIKFPPKSHYNKNCGTGTNVNSNKSRWTSSSKVHSKVGNDIKTHRKNSNPMSNFNFVAMQQQSNTTNGKQNKQIYPIPNNNNYHTTSTTCYNKSSSYPNFNSSGNTQHGNQHHSYHRHSVSNLITITPSQTTASIVTPSAGLTQHQQQKPTNCVGLSPAISKTSSAAIATKLNQNTTNGRSSSTGGSKQILTKNVIGDINSRLEFLCLQMTEQAIN